MLALIQKISLTVLITMSALQISGQNLKKFTERQNLGLSDKTGVVTYTYYQDPSLKWIKQGTYSFISSLKNSYGGTYSLIVNGNHSKDLQTGTWSYKILLRDYMRTVEIPLDGGAYAEYNSTGSITLLASYKQGIPDGLWSYKSKMSIRGVGTQFGRITYGQSEDFQDVEFSINFKNAVYNGLLRIQNQAGLGIAEGNFKEGVPDGIWIFNKNRPDNYTSTYKAGILYKSGNTVDPKMQGVIDDYLSGEVRISDLNTLGLSISEFNIFDKYHFKSYLDLLRNSWDFPDNPAKHTYYSKNGKVLQFQWGLCNTEKYDNFKMSKQASPSVGGDNNMILKNTIVPDCSDSSLRLIIHKIAGGRKLSENIDPINKREIFTKTGDINNDGLSDLIIQYQFEPNEKDIAEYGNSASIDLGGLIIYLNNGQGYSFLLHSSDFNGKEASAGITKIEKGFVFIKGYDYSATDANCCPTIVKETKLKLVNNRLVQVK